MSGCRPTRTNGSPSSPPRQNKPNCHRRDAATHSGGDLILPVAQARLRRDICVYDVALPDPNATET